MPPEFLELAPEDIAAIARENVALGLASEQPIVFGWEGQAPQYAEAAAAHDGLTNGLFSGAAGQSLTDKPAIVLNFGGPEANA